MPGGRPDEAHLLDEAGIAQDRAEVLSEQGLGAREGQIVDEDGVLVLVAKGGLRASDAYPADGGLLRSTLIAEPWRW